MTGSHVSRLERCQSQLRDFLDAALRGIPVEKILERPASLPIRANTGRERGPSSGKWSANENLAHLGRYHEIFLERIERMLTEPNPVFERYRAEEDPRWEEWRTMGYKEVAGKVSGLREKLMARLKSLAPEDWERTGTHSKFGEMSLALWLEFFLVHEAHHLYVVLQLVRR